jgi:hypothetical protein
MDLQYVRTGAAPVAKVDATALAATDSAHADNKAFEVDATDAPGLYRVDWPDAAFAVGARQVILTVKYATAFTEHMAVEIDTPVDVAKISTDATAADNCELMFDGTGYAGGSTKLGVDAVAISGDTTAANNCELAFDTTGYGFTNCTMPTVTTLTGHTAQTGDNYARLGAPAGASVSADVAAVKSQTTSIIADTNELQTDWTDGGRLDLILDAVSAPTAAAVADAVWDEVLSGHLGAGVTGEALNAAGAAGDPWITGLPGAYTAGQAGYIIGTNLNATVSSRSSHAAADVWSVAARVLTANTNLNDPTAATIADAVWDELTTGHIDAGKAGAQLWTVANTIAVDVAGLDGAAMRGTDSAYTGTPPTAASISDAVWDELSTGHVDAGKAGAQLWTDLDAVLVDTGELQTDWTDGGRLDLILDAVSAPTAAAVADAVWDELVTGHDGAGKAGAQLWTNVDAILVDTGTDIPATIATVDGIVDAILIDTGTTLPAEHALLATAANLAVVDGIADAILEDTGTTLSGNLSTIAGYIDTEVGAISTAIAALNNISTANVQTYCTAALNAYDPPTKTELDSGLAGLNDLTAAEVNAQVDTALADYDGPTDTEMDAGHAAILAAVALVDSVPEPGASACTLTINDTSGGPIASAYVWLTSDAAGATTVAGASLTSALGEVTFMLTAGSTYYLWAQKDGVNFTNPQTFVAVAD